MTRTHAVNKLTELNVDGSNVSGFFSLIGRTFSECSRGAIHRRHVNENIVACPSGVELASLLALISVQE